ncbi:MAG: hypothetical protein ACOYMN_00195 [Roseimicrobium sp.]
MSCTRCHDLCVTYATRTPRELRKAVSIVSASLADGTLREVPSEDLRESVIGTFEAVVAGPGWPDTFDFWFECATCAERFCLQADTYHGAGGSWRPARAEASRESL